MQGLPNLLIIGVNKAATTSLRQYLVDHPAVCGADRKELFFWSRVPDIDRPDLTAYREHFRQSLEQKPHAKIVVDNTPRYFHDCAPFVERIPGFLGADSRAIVVLREPKARLLSYFKFKKRSLEIPKSTSFETFVKQCLQASPEERKANRRLLEGAHDGLYDVDLAKWHAVYQERLLVVFFDSLSEKPEETLISIARWLGIDSDFFKGRSFERENKSINFKHAGLHRFSMRFFRRFERFLLHQKGLRQMLTRWYYRLNGRPFEDRMTNHAAELLDDFYAPSLKRLRELLIEMGYRDLPPWLQNDRNHA